MANFFETEKKKLRTETWDQIFIVGDLVLVVHGEPFAKKKKNRKNILF